MKKIFLLFTILCIVLSMSITIYAKNESYNQAEFTSANNSYSVNAKSAVLIEANTGKVIFSQNENERRSPASVTKVMTLLLVVEALRDERIKLEDTVTISENASSMGGSQVFLEEGEKMSVEELLKCTIIASANDAAFALAEYTYGSEETFISEMNKRAAELGMENSNFENVTGLDDTVINHYTSALDIALKSCELIKYDIVKKYASLWQDTIRDGEFTLTNTNRLVRFYDGCNGLKTGSTAKAGYCISASAKRGDMQLKAVIMGAETRDIRNNEARKLLDFGFANYTVFSSGVECIENVPVLYGKINEASIYSAGFKAVIPKSDVKKIEVKYDIPESITAPVSENQKVGKITYILNGEVLGESDIIVKDRIEKITFWSLFKRIICDIFIG